MKEYQKKYQKEYRKNMSDEQKQKYKENRNKRNKDKCNKMTDEQKQRMKDYQREYRRNMTDEQKQRYKKDKCNKDINDKKLNSEKIIITVIKDDNHFNDVIKLLSTNKILKTIYNIKNYKYGRLLLNKTRQIVYFNCFVSVFCV